MNYKEEIEKVIKDPIIKIEPIQASNKVFKVYLNNNKVQYIKFYTDYLNNQQTNTDLEIQLYNILKKDTLNMFKPLVSTDYNTYAIFEEVKGTSVDNMSEETRKKYSKKIIESLNKYFDVIYNQKVEGYGKLEYINKKFIAKYETYNEFIEDRQNTTSKILKDYKELEIIYDLIKEKYSDILFETKQESHLCPIDTNMSNILIDEKNNIIFIDPGQMIGSPTILMAYGDFIIHTYNTSLYNELFLTLKLTEKEKILINIYAIFSALNTLAYLKKVGVEKLNEIHSFGNSLTFYKSISVLLKSIDIENVMLDKVLNKE